MSLMLQTVDFPACNGTMRPLAKALARAIICGMLAGAVPAMAAEPGAGPTWSLQALEALKAETTVLTLEQAWRLAVENSPEYQAALSGRAAAQTEKRQGRAALLPNVQAGYYRGRIRGVQRSLIAPANLAEARLDYDSENLYVQLRQPLINFERYAGYRIGQTRAAVGEAEFRATEMELALRLTEVYVRAVHAQESLALVQALADSLAKQAVALRALYEKNEATRIDAQEVEGRLALARADVVQAEQEHAVALRELSALTGVEVGELPAPLEPFPEVPSPFPPLEQWLAWVRERSPAIQLAREERQLANAEVSRASGRHLPSVELVAGWTQADSENLSTLSQRYDTFNVGLSMSIPIYSGGYDTAAHAQARARLRQSEHETNAAEESAMAETLRQHANVVGGLDRVRALEQAAEAAQANLQAVQRSLALGMASTLDTLRARDRSHDASRRLLQARLQVINGYAALCLLAGDPAWEALLTTTDWFTSH